MSTMNYTDPGAAPGGFGGGLPITPLPLPRRFPLPGAPPPNPGWRNVIHPIPVGGPSTPLPIIRRGPQPGGGMPQYPYAPINLPISPAQPGTNAPPQNGMPQYPYAPPNPPIQPIQPGGAQPPQQGGPWGNGPMPQWYANGVAGGWIINNSGSQAQPGQAPGAPGGFLSNILSGLGISNASPLQPTYVNNPPMVNPTTLGGDFLSQFSPDQSIGQILNYAGPAFNKAQNSLNDQLAAMGMFGGPAASATGALNSQLLSSLGPMLSQAVQQSQGNMLNAGEFNANALNQGNYFNAQNIIGANNANAGIYNNAQNNLWNAIMQGWMAPFNAYQGINMAGLNGAQGLAGIGASNAGSLGNIMGSTFPVNTSNPFGGLGSALGGLFAQAPQPSQPAQPPSDPGVIWA